ncbi:hypothetical protein M8J76_012876 [Diaphorina citri]|nr:hypothetical protein M8J76_012876 [Diaphorina citri]
MIVRSEVIDPQGLWKSDNKIIRELRNTRRTLYPVTNIYNVCRRYLLCGTGYKINRALDLTPLLEIPRWVPNS